MSCKNYLFLLIIVFFSNVFVTEAQTIKIEAESFTSESGGVKVENARSIGYFGAAGTSVTYSVNIATAGDYEVTYSYLSGGSGNIKLSATGVTDKALPFTQNSTVNPNWWETPFTSWTVSAKTTVTFQSGTQNLTLKAGDAGIGVNIDWIQLTALVPCTDNVIQAIKLTPSKTSCKVGDSIGMTVVGKSSCKELPVSNPQWSANAPNGTFTASAEGSFEVSVSVTVNGKTYSDKVTITVTNVVIDCSTPVAFYGKMQAVGNRIFGAKINEPMQVKGASFFWSQWSGQYWNTGTVDYMVDNMKVELLRCAWGVDDNGNACEGDLNKLYTVVDQCIKRGIYVIIDWHAHTMDKNPGAAISFFNTVAAKYGKVDNVIFELFNEPRQDAGLTWPIIKSAQEQVLPTIRKYSDNLCIIGTPWFSQDVDVATTNPINDNNLAYAIHWYVANHCAGVWNKIPVAMNNKKPLFGSEWGFWAKESWSQCADQNFDQNVVAALWMQKMDESMISWASWAIADKTSEQSSLFTGGFNLSNSGNWLKSNLEAWSKDPKNKWRRCDVCVDYTVKELTLTAPKTIIGVGLPLQLTVTGKSSCRDLVITNPTWSANAPGGVFQSNTLGDHTVSVTANGITKSIIIKVVQDPNTLIYKPINGVLTALNTEWYSYCNATSTVSKVTAITDGAKIDYAITKGLNAWDNTAGYGFNMVDLKTKKPFDLTGSTGIKFKYKGPACTISAKLDTVDVNKDFCYHTATVAASPNAFTEYTITWNNFLQPSWGKQVGLLGDNLKGVNGFQFTYAGATGDKGSLVISEVSLLDVIINSTPTSLRGNQESKFKLYPNPSEGIVTIEVDNTYTVDAYNVVGNKVYSQIINESDNTIDLSSMKGLLVLKIYNNSASYVEKVLIK